ncbi:ankyrin repeat domain-containing protein, partial [Acidobacteriota bacterium]
MRKIIVFLLVYAVSVCIVSGAEIHQAVARGQLEAVKTLVEKEPGCIHLKDKQGSTPLYYAAGGSSREIVKLLIQKGANVNAANFEKVTPMHVAAYAGRVPIAQLLIEAGADINARNAFGDTPLHWAVFYGRKELVNLLVEKGVNVDAKSDEGTFFLHEGAAGGHEKLVNMLIEKGANIKTENSNGGTLLHSSASGGLIQLVELTIKKGDNVNAKNRYGMTPLHNAANNGHIKVIQLLITRGADSNAAAYDGKTPLHTASEAGLKNIVDFLIEKGAADKPKQFPLLKGEYLGQKPPGLTPGIFAPGIVSTPAIEFANTFSPNGSTFYFTRFNIRSMKTTILMMNRENQQWAEPQVAPFSGQHSDFEAVISYDGKKLYFCSNRPLTGKKPPKDQDIWVVEKTQTGWSEPVNPGPPLNSDGEEFYPTLTRDGTIYFRSDRPGGIGKGDFYRSKFVNGKYSPPQNLGNTVNTEFDELNIFVSADEKYIIFASRGRPDSFGGNDLYISFRKADG